MAELVFRIHKVINEKNIDEAIDTNRFITVEDYKIIEDTLTFIPMFDEAIQDKFDVCHFAIHMGKELGVALINIRE